MQQVILSQVDDNISTIATEYTPLGGGNNWSGTQEVQEQVVTSTGTLSFFKVELHRGPSTGSYTFKLKNVTAATELSLSIAGAAVTGEDVGSIAVTQGDHIVVECTPSTPGLNARARISAIFEGDNANESLILCTVNCNRLSVDTYGHLGSGNGGTFTTEASAISVVPTAGKLKNLIMHLTVDPGTSPEGFSFEVRVNGEDKALIVIITADDTDGSDLANEVVVAAGDKVSMHVTALNTPAVGPTARGGLTFVADEDGESMYLGGGNSPLHATDTKHNYINRGVKDSWDTSGDGYFGLMQAAVIKKLYVELAVAPGGGKSFAFTADVEGTSRLTATIADAAKTGNSGATEYEVSDWDAIILQCAPSGSPDVGPAYWGAVCFIAPAAGIENKSGNMAAKMMARGLI